MPRIRTIKPNFWDSPSTAQASHRARLFYIAMWNWADDYGVGTANAKALTGFAFPNDVEISAKDYPSLRKEVADSYGVVFYEESGRPYYYIPSWDEHQRTERKSKRYLPPPPDDITAGQTLCVGTTVDTQGTSDATQGTTDDTQGSSGVGSRKLEVGNSARKKPATAIPDNWQPTSGHEKIAHEKRLDLDYEATRFRNHALANDRRAVRWDAAFNNWLSKSEPTKQARNPKIPEGW